MMKAQPGRAGLLKRLTGSFDYTVREGDTLADILRISGSSVHELMARNAHCNLFDLKLGQRLRLPMPASAHTYRVRRGEDVYTLARKFDRSVVSLLKSNAHLRPAEIRYGAYIVLPEDDFISPSPAQ
jgi:LysM repeat protein